MRSDEGTKELGTVGETLPRNHYLTAYKKSDGRVVHPLFPSTSSLFQVPRWSGGSGPP